MPITVQGIEIPDVKPGDPVLWYCDANTSQSPEFAIVKSVDGRVIDVVTIAGAMRMRQEVHHVSDPVLKENRNIRAYGGWAEHPKFKYAGDVHNLLRSFEDRFETGLNALKRRLEKIEDGLGIRPEDTRIDESSAEQAVLEAVVPHDAPHITPADVGLKHVGIGVGQSQTIEGGNIKEPLTADRITNAMEGRAMRKGDIARVLGYGVDEVEMLLTLDNGFTVEHGWVKRK